jgi:glutathione S-transferase
MKLIASHTSPYARKVRVMLAEKKLACELMEENVWAATTQVTRFNPLTKIPALVLDDGTSLYDSSVITEYLDTLSAPALIPAAGLARALVRRDESLADGICDAAVAIVLEKKRDAPRQDPAWMERQRGKIDAATEALARALGQSEYFQGRAFSLADLAIGCALFYVEFRLPEVGWRAKYPALKAWAERIEARPSFTATRPPGT